MNRKDIQNMINQREEIKRKLEEGAYELYKGEIGKTLEGLPVEVHGYKKVLRSMGFVI